MTTKKWSQKSAQNNEYKMSSHPTVTVLTELQPAISDIIPDMSTPDNATESSRHTGHDT